MSRRFQFSLSQVLVITALVAMGFWAIRGMETSVRPVFAICGCYAGTCFGGAVGVIVRRPFKSACCGAAISFALALVSISPLD